MKDGFPPTLGQIAERAGVDRSTVSLALRNDPRLKPATCLRIQSLAAEMGYRQNPAIAQLMSLLRAGRKHHFQSTIGVLNFGLQTLASSQVLMGAKQKAEALGYGLEVFDSQDFEAKRLDHIFMSRGIRGLLGMSQIGRNQLPDDYRAIWEKYSCCIIGLRPINPSLHFVADDNYMTAMTATGHLHEMGFRRIGLVMHRGINSESEYRFVGGYLAAHSALQDLEALPILFLAPGGSYKDALRSWYKKEKPNVVICIEPDVLHWFKAAGVKVPDEVSLVSLDVGPASKNWAGMLQNRFELGSIAIDVVVTQINHNEKNVPLVQRATLTESTWMIGETLKPPQNKR